MSRYQDCPGKSMCRKKRIIAAKNIPATIVFPVIIVQMIDAISVDHARQKQNASIKFSRSHQFKFCPQMKRVSSTSNSIMSWPYRFIKISSCRIIIHLINFYGKIFLMDAKRLFWQVFSEFAIISNKGERISLRNKSYTNLQNYCFAVN